jgi:hypothetical protein
LRNPKPIGRRPSTDPFKTCVDCGETKPRTEEFFYRRGVASWQSACKTCRYERSQRWITENPERARQRWKQYRESNQKQFRHYDAQFRERHAEKLREKRRTPEWRAKKNAYQRKVRQERPEYRIRGQLGGQLNTLLARHVQSGAFRGKSFVERFGYAPEELRVHLERQFTKRMSWQNYGTYWEIDHTVPCRLFKLPEETRACFALTNLRPLPKVENRRKQGRRLHLL